MNSEFVQHDTASKLQVTCVDETGTPINLTGCTVSLQYYIGANPPFYSKTMTIMGASTGVVEYQFGSSVDVNGDTVYDLYDAGMLYFRVSITFGSGRILTCPNFGEIAVRPILQ